MTRLPRGGVSYPNCGVLLTESPCPVCGHRARPGRYVPDDPAIDALVARIDEERERGGSPEVTPPDEGQARG